MSYLLKRIDDDVIRDRLVFPDANSNYPLALAVRCNHFSGVLKLIVKGDSLNLADYEAPNNKHITSHCLAKCAQSASLLLRNITKRERRNKLIEKQYTFVSLLHFVW